MKDKYTCAVCGETFIKGQSDEDAAAELVRNFGVPQEECDLVCDDCYKQMFPEFTSSE